MKANVNQFLTSRYADFNVVVASTCTLYNQVKSLSDEVDQTAKRIETEMRVRLDTSTHEFEELSLELRRCEAAIRALEKLMVAHECLQEAERSVAAQSYKASSLALARLQHVLDEISEGHEDAAKVVQALHTECVVQRESLRHALAEQWSRIVVCTFKETAPRTQQQSSGSGSSVWEAARLRVAAASSKAGLGDVLQAMDGEGMLDTRLRDLAGLLLNVFHVVLKNSSSKLTTSWEASSQSHVLTLSVAAGQATDDALDVPNPKPVLDKLQSVLSFVHEHLSSQCVVASAGAASPPSVTRRLGSHAAVPLLQALVDDCLALAVPRTHHGLDSFRAVADEAAKFQAFLTSIDFLPADGNASMLSDYVSNVHVLFANKKCQEILEHARELMKTDLLRMRKIRQEEQESDLVTPIHSADDVPSNENPSKQFVLHRNTFRMPPCCISESASGLIAYAHRMLEDAADSGSYGDEAAAMRCAAQIFCCVRGMFELYCAVSPVYHRRQVELLPQAAALFYNNSMYLAHELLTLGHAYRHKWLAALDAECRMTAATFVDLVPKLRALGTDCFLQQLDRQKQLLAESMKSADGFKNLEERPHFAAAERGVGQCMSILRHLHGVWRDVLPINTYLKAIGALLNGVLEEVVTRVLNLEDITEEVGKLLEHLFDKISDGSPHLFVLDEDASNKDGPPDEFGEKLPSVQRSHAVTAAAAAGLLQRHTPKWQRFKELQRMFSANLHDVSERWAEGKGPLAAEFSSADVRQLVRALFQNTERRAAVLAKIR